jgi:predicted RNA polymerase sigma factor
MYLPFFNAVSAHMLAKAGEHERAARQIEDALRLSEENGEKWCEPEIFRIRGCMLLESNGRQDEAEADFRRSIDLAQTQQAKLWEVRTSISLARLWQSQGKHSKARDLLAPVHAWFTDGVVTADLKEAGAVLEELEA